jgi:hypothetical protein
MGAGRTVGTPIWCRHLVAVSRKQKLFPHFGEAGAAIFAVKQVEPGGHDRTLADHQSHAIVFCRFVPGKKVNRAREFLLTITISYQNVRNDVVIRGSDIQVLRADRTADR